MYHNNSLSKVAFPHSWAAPAHTMVATISTGTGESGSCSGGSVLTSHGRIIALADNPNLCIGINNTVDLWWEQSINTNNCSLSDNFSQMYQFWV